MWFLIWLRNQNLIKISALSKPYQMHDDKDAMSTTSKRSKAEEGKSQKVLDEVMEMEERAKQRANRTMWYSTLLETRRLPAVAADYAVETRVSEQPETLIRNHVVTSQLSPSARHRPSHRTSECNGVEERYDRLLYSCFGVTVSPPDSLLCECCVRQLRNTDRFRALVYAALDRPLSSSNITTESRQASKKEESVSISYKDIVELLNNTISSDKTGKKRFAGKRHALNSIARNKRVNVECVICKKMYHQFPKETECFICTRCKRNFQSNCQKLGVYSQTSAVASNAVMKQSEVHVKQVLRKRKSSPKKVPLPKSQGSQKIRGVPKYKCPVCPKKYMTPQHLVEHIKFIHGSRWNSFCGICCTNIRNESYEKHIQLHAEIANPMKSVKMGSSKQTLKAKPREKRAI